MRRYQSSAMCSSLDGSHKRAITSTAATASHGTVSRPRGNRLPKNTSRPKRFPKEPAQPDVPERSPVFHTNGIQTNALGLERFTFLEEFVLVDFFADELAGECPSPTTTVRIERSKVGNRLLPRLSVDPHGSHETPVRVRLPVLLAA